MIVMTKLRCGIVPRSYTELRGGVVALLTPDQPEPVRAVNVPVNQFFDFPHISEAKYIKACRKVGDKEAPSPDCVPTSLSKPLFDHDLELPLRLTRLLRKSFHDAARFRS